MGSTSGSDCGKLIINNNNNNNGNKSGLKWEYPYGCSWPPRHYTCSFCKREFKSAQALGGHMNVHRRDRAARYIEHSPSVPPPPSTYPPWLHGAHAYQITPPPNPNPNPNFLYYPTNPSGLTPLSSSSLLSSSPAAAASIYTHQYSLVSLSLSCLSSSTLPYCGGVLNHSSMASMYGVKGGLGGEFHGPSSSSFKEDKPRILDLKLGLFCRDTKDDDDDDDGDGDGLDLELRLGNKKP